MDPPLCIHVLVVYCKQTIYLYLHNAGYIDKLLVKREAIKLFFLNFIVIHQMCFLRFLNHCQISGNKCMFNKRAFQ